MGHRDLGLAGDAQPGLLLTRTAAGVALVTGETVGGMRISEPLASDVRRYLDANKLTGPIIRASGQDPCDIHLMTGIQKAERAIAALPATLVTVLAGGVTITLPSVGRTGPHTWAGRPDPTGGLPTVLTITSAVRAVLARRANR
ncbi:hypothetical protein [Nocardia rhamnosiphila]